MSRYSTTFVKQDGSDRTLTPNVVSYRYFRGRRSYLDNWTGNQLTFVMRNDTGQAITLVPNERVQVNLMNQNFWIATIDYDDAISSGSTQPAYRGSTATVVCDDILGRLGRIIVNGQSLTQAGTCAQINQMSADFTANDLTLDITAGNGSSTASAATYTGSILNRLNLNMNTEKGQVRLGTQNVKLLPRNTISIDSSKFVSNKSSGPTTTFYQDFKRQTLGQSFVNQVTVNADGLAAQTASNSSSISTYKVRATSVSTVDATTGQALDLATWLSKIQADPLNLTYKVTVTDTVNTSSVFTTWLSWLNDTSLWGINLQFSVPGVGDAAVDVVLEGVEFSGDTQKNVTTAYFSPWTFYNVFILDNATFGVLNTGKLGF